MASIFPMCSVRWNRNRIRMLVSSPFQNRIDRLWQRDPRRSLPEARTIQSVAIHAQGPDHKLAANMTRADTNWAESAPEHSSNVCSAVNSNWPEDHFSVIEKDMICQVTLINGMNYWNGKGFKIWCTAPKNPILPIEVMLKCTSSLLDLIIRASLMKKKISICFL